MTSPLLNMNREVLSAAQFSWQAQGIVRLRGVREVTFSWQAQYFARVRRVDGERFVAGAGNREVVSCGRGECRCHIGIGV